MDTRINGAKCSSKWTEDIKLAEKELTKLIPMRRAPTPTNQYTAIENNITVREFLELYYTKEGAKFSIPSLYKQKRLASFMLRDYLDLAVNQITFDDLSPKIITATGKKTSTGKRSSAQAKINALNKLVKFAQRYKIPFSVDIEGLNEISDTLPKDEEKIYFLDSREVAILFKYLEQNPGRVHRVGDPSTSRETFKRAITCSLYNGLRLGEVISIRLKNINFSKNLMTIESTKHVKKIHGYKRGTKNGRTRTIEMAPHTKRVLEEIIKQNPDMKPDDLFFPFCHSWAQKHIKDLHEATFKDEYTGEIVPVLNSNYSFHTFRHTFASLFFKVNGMKDKALHTLMGLMGHAKLDMTLRYVHVYENSRGNLLGNLTFTDANKIEKATEKNLQESIAEILSGTHLTESQFRQQVLDILKGA